MHCDSHDGIFILPLSQWTLKLLFFIQVVQIEPLLREPNYDLDLKALRIHCRSEWESMNMNALIEKKQKEVSKEESLINITNNY